MSKRNFYSRDPHSHNNGGAEKKLDAFYERQYKSDGDPKEVSAQSETMHALDLGQGLATRPKYPRSDLQPSIEPLSDPRPAKNMAFFGLVAGVILLAVVVLGLFYYPAWSAGRGAASAGRTPAVPDSALNPRAQARQLDEIAETLKSEATATPGTWSQAETVLQNALKADPLNARAYKLLGDVYSRQNRLEAALESYQKALKGQPNYLEAVLQLALTCDKLRNMPEAIVYYQRASQIRPADSSIGLRLASLYTAAGRNEDAIGQYRTTLALRLDNHTRAQVHVEIARLTRLLRAEKMPALTESAAPPKAAMVDPITAVVDPAAKDMPPVKSAPAAQDPVQTAALPPKEVLPLSAPVNLAFPPPVLREVIATEPEPTPSGPSVSDRVSPPSPSANATVSNPAKNSARPAGDLVAPRNLTVALAPLPKPVAEGDELSADAVDKKPVLRTRVDPRMPAAARNFSGSASVFMSIKISETGRVVDTRIIRKPERDLGFSQAAEAAVRQWRYEPATKNGVRVKVWTTCQIHFKPSE